MSVCTFIASDSPLIEVIPLQNYPLEINVASGTVYDGDAADNYSLQRFTNVKTYTEKNYAVSLAWKYTDGRAKKILQYIENALSKTDVIEVWHVWLIDYWEFEDRPFVHRKKISLAELTTEHIKELDHAEIWNKPDRMYPGRPSFYCLTITHSPDPLKSNNKDRISL